MYIAKALNQYSFFSLRGELIHYSCQRFYLWDFVVMAKHNYSPGNFLPLIGKTYLKICQKRMLLFPKMFLDLWFAVWQPSMSGKRKLCSECQRCIPLHLSLWCYAVLIITDEVYPYTVVCDPQDPTGSNHWWTPQICKRGTSIEY